MDWPHFSWKQFFNVLTEKEKRIFIIFLSLFSLSFLFVLINFYLENTEVQPAQGGSYTEGIIGNPRLINPIYAPANDADRDLAELIFSGLMGYNGRNESQPDLAESYQILEEGKVYEFLLKENLAWSDGQPLNADDIVFTVKTIQSPDYKSPLRSNWLGVEAEKVSDTVVRFKLKNPSAIFLENMAVKILPKHIWQNVSSANFPLVVYNLKPVGSGPFKLKNLKQNSEGKITSLDLVKNAYYSGQSPNISRISLKFFDSEKQLLDAYKKGLVQGLSMPSLETNADLENSANIYSPSLPRYFAVFFNPQKIKFFNEKEIRQAFNYGTNKKEIISQFLLDKGKIVDSPVLPEIYGYAAPSKTYEFNPDAAKLLLDKAGFKEGQDGIREKTIAKEPAFQFKSNLKLGSQGQEVQELQKCLEVEITGYFGEKTKEAVVNFQEKYSNDILKPNDLAKGTGEVLKSTRTKLNDVCLEKPEERHLLKFSLVTSNHPQLIKIAELLKNQWKAMGAKVEIKIFDVGTLEREIIKTRDYDALLFGEIMGIVPDPFPFWHSSQKKDPGLNLSLYENKEADKLLRDARELMDNEDRQKKLEKFQNIFIEDAPAVLLYSPDYLYLVAKKIKGIDLKTILDSSKRFSNIENWYIKTKRIWR